MGKFTLLTTLTLSAAGFNKGIDGAKKSTKALGDGVKTAGNTMATAFKPLGGILSSVSGQLGGVTSVATGGVSAFKSMIPAITGIKTALISTGIGALVVALGTAFAALASYIKGTEEGANKLQKVMAFMKGAFNAILVRVQLLGEAVSLVFEGKFKQASEKLKEAFQGGLLQEIKDDAAEAVGYAERENKLWRDKLEYKKKESDLTTQINDLKLIAWNQELPAEQRQKAITKAKELELSLMNEAVRLAQEEYDIVKSQNAMGNNSREDTEKEVELYVKINAERSSYLKAQREYLEKQKQINSALQKTADIQREIPLNSIDITNGMSVAINNIAASIDKIDSTKLVEMKAQMVEMITIGQVLGQVWKDMLTPALEQMQNVFISGANSFKDYAKNIKSAVKSIIGAFIAEGVAAMVMNALKDWSSKVPFGYIIAPAMAALAGGLAKTAFNSLIPKFADGGIVSAPTMAMVGEYSNARNNPEVIAPLDRLQRLIGGAGGGEVTFRIQGDELVGILNKTNKKYSRF